MGSTVNTLAKHLFGQISLIFIVGVLSFVTPVFSEESLTDLELFRLTENYLNSNPEKAAVTLTQLGERTAVFSKKQKDDYFLLKASFLGLRGRNRECVQLILEYIDSVSNVDSRSKFLYELSTAYTALGEYENALKTMNRSIYLLGELTDLNAKISTLQSAITLLVSLHVYDEALLYADRMMELKSDKDFSAQCYGLTNKVEINFLSGNAQQARLMLRDAEEKCDANRRTVITRYLKVLAAIDLIESGKHIQGLNAALPLMQEFAVAKEYSENSIQLETAIARDYFLLGKLSEAERHGLLAYQHAKSENMVQLMERASETIALIKRAQGDMAGALDYYDINLALKKKVLDDQLHKNLAYQRVKFDTQDKANQLTLLEQKNKILGTEKKLEQRNNQNLLMLIALGAILMAILSAWTFKILKQKNLFRLSSQIDGLTQVSNRAYFVDCGTQQFEKTAGSISVILFDMDHFKNINDSFGHAVGDWVLKAVSERVKALLPDGGMLGRLGGEEFAICLPKLDQHQAQALAERCRLVIAAIDSNPSGFAFPVSASFGVASRGMRDLKEFEDTLAAADKALYFSKTEGRNRVSLYQ